MKDWPNYWVKRFRQRETLQDSSYKNRYKVEVWSQEQCGNFVLRIRTQLKNHIYNNITLRPLLTAFIPNPEIWLNPASHDQSLGGSMAFTRSCQHLSWLHSFRTIVTLFRRFCPNKSGNKARIPTLNYS